MVKIYTYRMDHLVHGILTIPLKQNLMADLNRPHIDLLLRPATLGFPFPREQTAQNQRNHRS